MNIFQQISITYVLVFIVFALVRLILATVVSGTADRKGYHAIAWFLFGFFGGFIISFAIITSLPNKNKTDEKLDMELLLLYKKLKDEDLISEKEYSDKKKELLETK